MNNPKPAGPRRNYSIKIPPNATPEEIKEFMKEFMKHWGKDDKKTTEQPSKPEQAQYLSS